MQNKIKTMSTRFKETLCDGIRTFSAAIGTTAVIMLTLCGILETIFPNERETRSASAFGDISGQPEQVQLGGDIFGVKLFSDGIIVAALSDIYTDGTAHCPARDAGIEVGDYVLSANGRAISSNAELSEILSTGNEAALTLRRDGSTYQTTVTPLLSGDNYLAGMWIRDSAAGLGTVTYYTADGTAFGALGHGICDSDTKALLALKNGEPAAIEICGIERSHSGSPGRLRGYFIGGEASGEITANTESGVFGTVAQPHRGQLVDIMPSSEVHTGTVEIIATIDDRGARSFEAEIERISADRSSTKDLIVHITDPELLEKTGGIVQGMSGSPILQDGKLIGAVTHVLVNDPTRGYGIFIENMLDAAG